MALKKAIVQLFTLPPEMDPDFDPAYPMTWTVKASSSGTQRQLDELILRNRFMSERTVQAYIAYVTFGGSTFFAEKDKKNRPVMMFPNGVEFNSFLEGWDLMRDDIIDWIMKCIYEVNPQFAPLPVTQDEDEEDEDETTEDQPDSGEPSTET